jgi:hypothetical protein
MFSKKTLILSTVALWTVGCALYGYYYVVTILALPEPYDAYVRNWRFQLFMFAIFRVPFLVVGLLLVIVVELIVFDLLYTEMAARLTQ